MSSGEACATTPGPAPRRRPALPPVADRAPIAGQQRVGGVLPGERRRVGGRGDAHRLPLGARLHAQQLIERMRPIADVVPGHQSAGDAVAHRHREPADRGGHHRRAAGLRLHGDQTEGLRIARHRNQIGGLEQRRQIFPGLRRQECHPLADAEFVRQAEQPVRRRQPAARRPAGHHDAHPRQLGGGAQHDVGCLQRLNSPDERHHGFVWSQPQRGPGGQPVTRPEHVQVDAGVNHVDLRRIGMVDRNQLPRFIIGVDDQPVCLIDDLLLADRAQRRLGRVTFGQRRVLHRGERVRGVHQRHRPAVPGQPTDLAGQPVVRVHDVVVARFVGGLGAQHPGRERAQLGGQVVFVQALERPGHHVAHQHAGGHPLHRRIGGRGGPGEDLHLDAPPGQMQRALQHVDVHSAGIAGARLGQR